MVVPFGLVVRIPGSHPGGPGSIHEMEKKICILIGNFLALSAILFIYLFILSSTILVLVLVLY